MKCKNCNLNNAIKYSKYTNGNFCSSKCARSFSTKHNRKEINEKVKLKLTGKTKAIKIEKKCPECNNIFVVFKKHKNKIYCSKQCVVKSQDYRDKISINQKKRCENINERIRLKHIGRKGGFGTKGYTQSGIYYQSTFEKNTFDILESLKIDFVPHKNIPNSSKVSDVFLINQNIWIELDGIDREKRKKWLGKDYEYWLEKLKIYEENNLNYFIIKNIKELKELLNKKIHTIEDAKSVLNIIHNNISKKATLIGGFGKGKTSSMHDIDILIPDVEFDDNFKQKVIKLLNAKSVESTDWGGLYFNNTDFGDVDIFYTTEDFDY